MQSKKIIVMDDDSTIRDIVITAIKGYYNSKVDIIEFDSTDKFLDYINHHEYDLLITDFCISPIDGEAIISYITGALKKTSPVILMSGFLDISNMKLFKSTINKKNMSVMTKPLKIDRLISKVGELIGVKYGC